VKERDERMRERQIEKEGEGGRECGRREEKRKRTLVFKRFTIQCYSRD
jgi:hypothetical protein